MDENSFLLQILILQCKFRRILQLIIMWKTLRQVCLKYQRKCILKILNLCSLLQKRFLGHTLWDSACMPSVIWIHKHKAMSCSDLCPSDRLEWLTTTDKTLALKYGKVVTSGWSPYIYWNLSDHFFFLFYFIFFKGAISVICLCI